MKRSASYISIWAIFAFCIAGAVLFSPSYQDCVHGQTGNAPPEHYPEDLGKLLPLMWEAGGDSAWCTGAFIEANYEAITALAAIAIAALTLALWIVGSGQLKQLAAQVQLARDEFGASHRPHIVLRNIFSAPLTDTEPIEISYTISNDGTGPCTIVQGTFVVEYVTSMGLMHVPALLPGRNHVIETNGGLIVLAAGEHKTMFFRPQGQVWTPTMLASTEGIDANAVYQFGVFFAGQLLYRDGAKVDLIVAFRRRFDSETRRFYPHGDYEHEYAD